MAPNQPTRVCERCSSVFFSHCSLIGLAYLALTITEGFSVCGLTSSHDYGLADFGSNTAARQVLEQPFRYIASGGQSYVFVSEDNRYVLKFFKGHVQPWTLLPQVRARKIKKLARALQGYTLLQEKLPEHSPTLYAHFDKSPFATVTLIDKLGIHHTVDLGPIECLLQRKVEPLSEHSREKVHALAAQMAQERITDTDPRQHKNWGVEEEKIVIFDAGRIAPDPQGHFQLSEKYLAWESQW